MGWWSKFLSFITPPPVKVDEVAKAKIVKAAVEEATVELEPFTSAKNVKEGIVPVTPKRARTKKGRYVADDKSTPDVNEAWEGGKAPKKKAVKKPKVKVVRVKKKK
jgi:hypothetical protein